MESVTICNWGCARIWRHTALSDKCSGLLADGWYGRLALRSEGPPGEVGLDEDILIDAIYIDEA